MTDFEVMSAGTDPQGVNPLAVQVMQESGIDISAHRSKSVSEFVGQSFDYVIAVCDRAREVCPTFPGVPATFIHWSFVDPAIACGPLEQKKFAFRLVRDNIARQIEKFLKERM